MLLISDRCSYDLALFYVYISTINKTSAYFSKNNPQIYSKMYSSEYGICISFSFYRLKKTLILCNLTVSTYLFCSLDWNASYSRMIRRVQNMLGSQTMSRTVFIYYVDNCIIRFIFSSVFSQTNATFMVNVWTLYYIIIIQL